jgi:hypothetical protein
VGCGGGGGFGGGGGGGGGSCGNGICDKGETADSCCHDCGCPAGLSCQNGSCTPNPGPVCGNNKCEAGETSDNCCQDCGCPKGESCHSGKCESSCGNGVCDGNETPNTCCQDCGCENGYACQNNSCSYIGTSTMRWAIDNECTRGGPIHVRFFDVNDHLYWPGGSYYTVSYGNTDTLSIECTTGNKICLGAGEDGLSGYWGVSLDGSKGCQGCCRFCANQTVSFPTLTCN